MILGVGWTDLITALATILALIVSTIAIYQTKFQTKISNKQFLFDKRIRAFYLLQELQGGFEVYRIKNSKKENNDSKETIRSKIDLLVDNSFFDDLGSNKNEQLKKKTKELMILSLEIKFYFPEGVVETASDFMGNYAMYLSTLIRRYERIDNIGSKQRNDKILVDAALKNIEKDWNNLEEDDTLSKLEKAIKFKN
ncbi:MAG: hypothetical protein ACTH21_08870 [Lactococcus lactis]